MRVLPNIYAKILSTYHKPIDYQYKKSTLCIFLSLKESAFLSVKSARKVTL